MLHRTLLILLLVSAAFFTAIQPVHAEEQVQDVVIYQTAFSTDPRWITNSPRSYYWVPEKGIYHYAIEPSSGAYSYIEVDYSHGPFTLEYDLTPQSTVENSAFRLGLTTKEMLRTKGTIALTEFTNGKNGKLMWLRVVTPSNNLFELSSYSYSYGEKTGGRTVNFVDNRTYHVVLQYDNVRNTLTMRVIDKPTGTEVWGYFITTNEELHDMDRIAIGPLGDFSYMGPVAEGYIDNVRLTTQETVTITPTATTAAPTQVTVVKTTTKPTAKPTTPEPTPTPASPVSPAAALAAVSLAGVAVLYKKLKQDR